MASRENMNIWRDIRKRDWKRFKEKIRTILSKDQFRGWDRDMILKDSLITPFNRFLGCKLFGHKWSTKEEMLEYQMVNQYCWKCAKWSTRSEIRDEKISQILK